MSSDGFLSNDGSEPVKLVAWLDGGVCGRTSHSDASDASMHAHSVGEVAPRAGEPLSISERQRDGLSSSQHSLHGFRQFSDLLFAVEARQAASRHASCSGAGSTAHVQLSGDPVVSNEPPLFSADAAALSTHGTPRLDHKTSQPSTNQAASFSASDTRAKDRDGGGVDTAARVDTLPNDLARSETQTCSKCAGAQPLTRASVADAALGGPSFCHEYQRGLQLSPPLSSGGLAQPLQRAPADGNDTRVRMDLGSSTGGHQVSRMELLVSVALSQEGMLTPLDPPDSPQPSTRAPSPVPTAADGQGLRSDQRGVDGTLRAEEARSHAAALDLCGALTGGACKRADDLDGGRSSEPNLPHIVSKPDELRSCPPAGGEETNRFGQCGSPLRGVEAATGHEELGLAAWGATRPRTSDPRRPRVWDAPRRSLPPPAAAPTAQRAPLRQLLCALDAVDRAPSHFPLAPTSFAELAHTFGLVGLAPPPAAWPASFLASGGCGADAASLVLPSAAAAAAARLCAMLALTSAPPAPPLFVQPGQTFPPAAAQRGGAKPPRSSTGEAGGCGDPAQRCSIGGLAAGVKAQLEGRKRREREGEDAAVPCASSAGLPPRAKGKGAAKRQRGEATRSRAGPQGDRAVAAAAPTSSMADRVCSVLRSRTSSLSAPCGIKRALV